MIMKLKNIMKIETFNKATEIREKTKDLEFHMARIHKNRNSRPKDKEFNKLQSELYEELSWRKSYYDKEFDKL